jgi:DNA topoisomerase IB
LSGLVSRIKRRPNRARRNGAHANAAINSHETEKLRKQAIVQAADKASEILANTRIVARSSYIHPSVIKAYESGNPRSGLVTAVEWSSVFERIERRLLFAGSI